MSRRMKRGVDKLLSILALLSITIVPVVYVVCTMRLNQQIVALEEELTRLMETTYTESSSLAVTAARPAAVLAAEQAAQAVETPQPIIPVAAGEEELLVRLVIAESGNQPYEGQVAVAQVVCDRYLAGYGDSITSVIYAKGQFAKPYAKDINKYPLASEAVHAVLYEGERAFAERTIFFCNPVTSSKSALTWMRTKPYVGTIANHEFYGA